ncbi:hypothetical protein PCCS19_00700 [Paenibacillus sp. CCS19]|uniref:hypothetical protein n=1 Tax=Paenibacillus sp. CCS19 TaxID=3158387 RepID=UPI0025658F93|nr:hypothetical protein [Paenibacillus cellulosilyticus]GMK37017.1 hypothetical protein PCCS19_00700 [Paenibacillus cellulosilyticus]
MRLWHVALTGLLMAIAMSACSDSNSNTPSLHEDVVSTIETESAVKDEEATAVQESEVPTSDISDLLMDEVVLTYQPVEWVGLEQVQIEDSWKLTKTVDFGQMNGESVSLSVFQEQDESALCYASYLRVVLLDYKGEHFKYMGCGNTSLESDQPDEEGSLVLLDYKSSDEPAAMIVHGAVDSGVNGPGLMTYYVYDAALDRWYGFNYWGLPSVNDLDEDGSEELLMQFQGLHNNTPDVSFGRWVGSMLEISATVKNLLGLPSPYWSADTVENGYVRVTMEVGEEGRQVVQASYMFSSQRLTRVDGT